MMYVTPLSTILSSNIKIDDNLPLVLTSDCGSECKDEPSTRLVQTYCGNFIDRSEIIIYCSFSSPPNCKNAENSLSLFSRIKMAYEWDKCSYRRRIIGRNVSEKWAMHVWLANFSRERSLHHRLRRVCTITYHIRLVIIDFNLLLFSLFTQLLMYQSTTRIECICLVFWSLALLVFLNSACFPKMRRYSA